MTRTARAILERLTAAETLERYLHTKFVGQKALLAGRRRDADPAARPFAATRRAQGVQ